MKFLKIVADELEKNNIDYQLQRFVCDELPPVFWVGSYSEMASNTEESKRLFSFTLTGTTTGSFLELENQKETIYNLFLPCSGGRRYATDDDGAVIIQYENAFPVETDDENVKRIQINLIVMEWGI